MLQCVSNDDACQLLYWDNDFGNTCRLTRRPNVAIQDWFSCSLRRVSVRLTCGIAVVTSVHVSDGPPISFFWECSLIRQNLACELNPFEWRWWCSKRPTIVTVPQWAMPHLLTLLWWSSSCCLNDEMILCCSRPFMRRFSREWLLLSLNVGLSRHSESILFSNGQFTSQRPVSPRFVQLFIFILSVTGCVLKLLAYILTGDLLETRQVPCEVSASTNLLMIFLVMIIFVPVAI